MAYTAADLKMVEDHIAQGERHVARQREILAFLSSRGYPTDQAQWLLTAFEATLLQHREHRELMLADSDVA